MQREAEMVRKKRRDFPVYAGSAWALERAGVERGVPRCMVRRSAQVRNRSDLETLDEIHDPSWGHEGRGCYAGHLGRGDAQILRVPHAERGSAVTQPETALVAWVWQAEPGRWRVRVDWGQRRAMVDVVEPLTFWDALAALPHLENVVTLAQLEGEIVALFEYLHDAHDYEGKTTTEIANRTNGKPGDVYAVCLRLERKGRGYFRMAHDPGPYDIMYPVFDMR